MNMTGQKMRLRKARTVILKRRFWTRTCFLEADLYSSRR